MPRKESYPWDVWFNGKEYQLQRGIDFQPSCRDFRNIVYQSASRRGLTGKIRVSIIDENTLSISYCDTQLVLSERTERAKLIGNIIDVSDNNFLSTQSNQSLLSKLFINSEKLHKCFEWLKELAEAASNDGKIIKRFTVQVTDKDVDGKIIREPVYSERGIQVGYKDKMIDKIIEQEVDLNELDSKQSFELIYPNDFSCHPKKAINLILAAARSYNIDVSNWRFEEVVLNSFQSKLVIYIGRLAEKIIEKEQEKILTKTKQEEIIPITEEKLKNWLFMLKENNYLQLIRGKDYSCASSKMRDILTAYSSAAGIRLYEASLTLEKGGVIVRLDHLDETAILGAGHDKQYVNEDYLKLVHNKNKILEYKRKLKTAVDSRTEKSIEDFTNRIEILERENAQLSDNINESLEKPILQPDEIFKISQEQDRKQKQLEEQQEKEDQARIANDTNSDPYSLPSQSSQQQITSQTSQPRTYTIPELQQKIILAKQKNNVTALRIFREKLAALGGKEE